MSSPSPADQSQPRNSLNEMETLADAQAEAITELREKLKQLEEERVRLLEKEKKVKAETAKREREAVRRCIASEFRLAQAKAFIPHKQHMETDRMTLTDSLQETGVLNPAVNLVYQKAYEAAKSSKTRLKQSYDDLIAWKFSPDTPSGKRLMSCMRQLLVKNEALGRANEVDRIATLEQEALMQATCVGEFMKTNQELDGVLSETSMDLEGVQSSLFILRQQLNQAESLIESLKNEYEIHNSGQADALVAAALASLSEIEAERDLEDDEEAEGDQQMTNEEAILEPSNPHKENKQEPSPITVDQLELKENESTA